MMDFLFFVGHRKSKTMKMAHAALIGVTADTLWFDDQFGSDTANPLGMVVL
jgi:hypothetical protein